jgi:hypothetical protein
MKIFLHIVVPELSFAFQHVNSIQIAPDNSGTTIYHVIETTQTPQQLKFITFREEKALIVEINRTKEDKDFTD